MPIRRHWSSAAQLNSPRRSGDQSKADIGCEDRDALDSSSTVPAMPRKSPLPACSDLRAAADGIQLAAQGLQKAVA